MGKVKLSDFFRSDFLSIVNSQRNRIQDILNKYEIAIFMARKAICFYDALMANGELHPTNCHVISSRVMDYDSLERFRGKKIAVIDDVVVKGISISRVAEKLADCGVTADYYIIACEESFSLEFSNQISSLNQSYHNYTQTDIYKLSGLISQYIEASMRTFNVDSPIYNIINGREVLSNLLSANSINITSGLQNRFGISNQVLYFGIKDKRQHNPISDLLKKTILKIRFYSNDEKTIAVPFVLLPECNLSDLELLYAQVRNDGFDALVQCDDENIHIENKFKLTSYLLAMALFCVFAKNNGLQYQENSYYDLIQFDTSIRSIQNSDQFESLCELFSSLKICNVEYRQFTLPYYTKSAYEFFSLIDPSEQQYTNRKGELIGRAESNEQDFLKRIVFSFDDLKKGINKRQPESKTECISSVIDILIDKGFIVPSVVHRGNDFILRAYKMGEYSKLTREQLKSFVKMLFMYQDMLQRRNVDRTEFEKLCVLFFRTQINQHIFGEETKFDDGCYSIGYSYYGPRMSSAQEAYTVSKDSALVTDFIQQKYVKKTRKGKYYVDVDPAIDDNGLYVACQFFVHDYTKLYNAFKNHPYTKTNNPWNQYIHTYDQFLTILSIGENRKNQILSLCAEIYQVICLKEEMFFDTPDQALINKYKPMLSGINSGLWKYHCFKGNALRKTTEKIMEYEGLDAVRAIQPIQTSHDKGDSLVKLRDEMGEFLFRAAYILNELLRISGRVSQFYCSNIDDTHPTSERRGVNSKTVFNKANFYFRKDVKAQIDSDIAESEKRYGTKETIKEYVHVINQEAQHLLDKCDLYLEKNTPNFSSVKEFVIAYSPSGKLPINFKRSTECVIKGLSENSKVAVFSIICEKERETIIDNLKCDTQDITDCIYILISSFVEDYEGYVQFDGSAKGTKVTKNIKALLKLINDLPDKSQRLFVIRQEQADKPFNNFKKTRVERLEKSAKSSATSKYHMDKYSIEREIEMEDKQTSQIIIYGGTNNLNQGEIRDSVVITGNQNNVNNSNNSTTEDFDEIETSIKNELLQEGDQEEAIEMLKEIKEKVNSNKKPSVIKAAFVGLKDFLIGFGANATVALIDAKIKGLL